MTELDNLHYNADDLNRLKGYHVPNICIISPRDAGKTTIMTIENYKAHVKTGAGFIYIVRHISEITEAYIHSFEEDIRKFVNPDVSFHYKTNDIKNGLVDVYIEGENEVFIRIQGLSKDINAQKRFRLSNVKYIIFDEFICNPKFGEKYLHDEYVKFREVVKTYQKDNPELRIFFLGNPYSLFNPYFVEWGVDTNHLKIGGIYSDKKTYVIDFYQLKPELIDWLKEKNPDYEVDSNYTSYALLGQPINDANISLVRGCPDGFRLGYVFKIEGKLIGVYVNTFLTLSEYDMYAEYLTTTPSLRRDVICFDFSELVEGSKLLAPSDKWRFERLKVAMRNKKIAFNKIEVYYYLEEIYYQL